METDINKLWSSYVALCQENLELKDKNKQLEYNLLCIQLRARRIQSNLDLLDPTLSLIE